MSNQTLAVTDEIYRYLLDVSLREADVLRELRAVTASHPDVAMQISPEQGQFMALLARLIDARRCLEIGVFTGYSSLSLALALPADGRILACDVSEEFTTIARDFWRRAGVEDKVDLRLAPALDTLDQLVDQGHVGAFDFAFIDADKVNYGAYYERCLMLLRAGGLVAVDNTLWSGSLADPAVDDPDSVALRAFNQHLHADPRVDLSLVPIGDGLTLARKRP